jgi:hypothetical protein
MKREQQMVAEFMYAAGQDVRYAPLDHPPQDLVERRFSWMFEEVSETHRAQNLTAIADGLGDIIYIALGAGLELGTQPFPQFVTLTGLLRKVEQSMRVKGHEINFIPQTTRSVPRCDNYIRRLVKSVSRFAYFNKTDVLTTALEHIIEASCEFSLYLGLPLPDIFDEIHASNMTKFIDGFRGEDGKLPRNSLSYYNPKASSLPV